MQLQRILEPEVMESLDEALDYDRMDHGEVNRRFVSDLVATGPFSGDILDLGTGTARIPIELCRLCPDVRVWAVDLSLPMLNLARAHVELGKQGERIRLERADAKRLSYADGRFSVVMSNSLVHHLADPRLMLSEAVRVTSSGGRLFIRDLARPSCLEDVERLVEQYVGAENDHGRQMFKDSLRAALTVHEMRGLVEQLGCDPSGVSRTSDRHWTWSVQLP